MGHTDARLTAAGAVVWKPPHMSSAAATGAAAAAADEVPLSWKLRESRPKLGCVWWVEDGAVPDVSDPNRSGTDAA